jgi:microcystin-dependent protein
MGRWQYDNVVIDQQGNALDNIQVTVYEDDTEAEATIYAAKTGGTTLPNPFNTTNTGLVQFFLEPGTYRIEWTDTELPIRVADREIYVESINAEDFEAISNVADTIWDVGDFKESVQTEDHSRWLLCDGREQTKAEFADDLGLDAAELDDFETLMGTGSSSIYGNTTGSNIKLPDLEGRFALNQGSTHPKKGAGSSGGAETVVLTQAQTPLKSHDHTASLSGLSGDTLGSGAIPIRASYNPNDLGVVADIPVAGGGGFNVFGVAIDADWYGNHYAMTADSHVHSFTITGASATVNPTSSDTASAHENMPPYTVKGNTFIRV